MDLLTNELQRFPTVFTPTYLDRPSLNSNVVRGSALDYWLASKEFSNILVTPGSRLSAQHLPLLLQADLELNGGLLILNNLL